jgi:hypothetical protein
LAARRFDSSRRCLRSSGWHRHGADDGRRAGKHDGQRAPQHQHHPLLPLPLARSLCAPPHTDKQPAQYPGEGKISPTHGEGFRVRPDLARLGLARRRLHSCRPRCRRLWREHTCSVLRHAPQATLRRHSRSRQVRLEPRLHALRILEQTWCHTRRVSCAKGPALPCPLFFSLSPSPALHGPSGLQPRLGQAPLWSSHRLCRRTIRSPRYLGSYPRASSGPAPPPHWPNTPTPCRRQPQLHPRGHPGAGVPSMGAHRRP